MAADATDKAFLIYMSLMRCRTLMRKLDIVLISFIFVEWSCEDFVFDRITMASTLHIRESQGGQGHYISRKEVD